MTIKALSNDMRSPLLLGGHYIETLPACHDSLEKMHTEEGSLAVRPTHCLVIEVSPWIYVTLSVFGTTKRPALIRWKRSQKQPLREGHRDSYANIATVEAFSMMYAALSLVVANTQRPPPRSSAVRFVKCFSGPIT